MRENPLPDSACKTYKGDNFVRKYGDTVILLELDIFINEANTMN